MNKESPEYKRVREEIAEVFREAYWFAKQHPKQDETLNIEELTALQSGQILNLIKDSGWMPVQVLWDEDIDATSNFVKDDGYLPVEPVQLEVLKLSKEQILGLIPAQAILDYNRAKEALEVISHATIIHNEKKGQLYRLR